MYFACCYKYAIDTRLSSVRVCADVCVLFVLSKVGYLWGLWDCISLRVTCARLVNALGFSCGL